MHILYVHKNFPAQFGHLASSLIKEHGYKCTFVSETRGGRVDGIYKVQYNATGGATEQTHYSARTFENSICHAAGIYDALKPLRTRLNPDLIVGHSGFGSTLFLPELFPDVPIINMFEYYYHVRGADLGFRPEFPVSEADRLRSRARSAMILLDLESCSSGYTPTHFQHELLPVAYQNKVRVLHDGVPTDFWHRRNPSQLTIGDREITPDMRLVTYVSRGFESMRGFDIFMQIAKEICAARSDVIFAVVGSDRVCYGGDLNYIRETSFREHVLGNGDYDLERIRFLGRVEPEILARLLSRTDLHIYLTVPFVLSWSVLNAMSCEAVVLASDTAPVREFVVHEQNGLLFDFYDVEGFVEAALQILQDPASYRDRLGRAARETIVGQYSLDVILPKMKAYYEDVAGKST